MEYEKQRWRRKGEEGKRKEKKKKERKTQMKENIERIRGKERKRKLTPHKKILLFASSK